MDDINKGAQVVWGGMGRPLDRDFVEEGELLVRREGFSRARHSFALNGNRLGRLRWRGLRRAEYEGGEARYDIYVGALEKGVRLISQSGGESRLIERSRPNKRGEGLRIEMAEGATFCMSEARGVRGRLTAAVVIRKAFQTTDLLVCSYETRRRTQTTLRIVVTPDMKRESRFFHRIIALVACWVILERRRQGGQPMKRKEVKVRGGAPKTVVRNRAKG
ncbi:MAG: hypothetical protein ACREDR_22780 [Blastocatellia bacterium]